MLSERQEIRIAALNAAIAFHKTPDYMSMNDRVEIRKQIIETAKEFVPYITDGAE